MLPVEFKKRLCHPVECKGQGPQAVPSPQLTGRLAGTS